MKVLYIITGLGMGGAEHVVVNLADKIALRGHQVKLAYLTGNALVLPNNPNIEVISLNVNSIKDLPNAYLYLRRVIKKFEPDIVHSHMFHSNILSRLIRITTNMPKLICTSHSNFEGGKIRILAYRITDKLATISTNVSENAAASMVSQGAYGSNRVVAIPNGVDVERFRFDSESRHKVRDHLGVGNKQMILAVGRMNPAKDYPNLFKSIALLKQYRNDFIVYIVGDGPLKPSLIELCKNLDISDCIVMLGTRHDIPELMSACDIFVLSSAWEGFGLVVAEAMATERVVVATDCGGTREIVDSSGFLVEPRNSELLAKELNRALSLSDYERSKLGAAARQRIIDNFSLEANVNAYCELYLS